MAFIYSLVKLFTLFGTRIDTFFLLLYRALDNDPWSRVEAISVPVGLLGHGQVLRQVVLVDDRFGRGLVLLVSLFLVLHVVEGTWLHEVVLLEVLVVRASWLGLAGVTRVGADVLDVVVDLADLLVNLLVLLGAVDVIDYPIVLLVGSDLDHTTHFLRFVFGATSLSLITGADVTWVIVSHDVGSTRRLVNPLLAETVSIWILLSIGFLGLLFVLDLVP